MTFILLTNASPSFVWDPAIASILEFHRVVLSSLELHQKHLQMHMKKEKTPQTIEEEINSLPLDEKLKLSKKSCFYTYQEIEEVKLISGKKPKFVILSEECVSKFSPNEEQFKQLADLLPTIEMLKR